MAINTLTDKMMPEAWKWIPGFAHPARSRSFMPFLFVD
jgi:hypothetical protein